jgi:hypothetical protein
MSGQVSGQINAPGTPAQAQPRTTPPDYTGVRTRIPGVFLTPISGQPFSAKVDIFSSVILPNGETEVRTTINRIARDSSGRIHNERRRLVPPEFKGEPALLETHIYDPATHLNIFINPYTHIARETVLRRPPITPPADLPPHTAVSSGNPQVTEADLGTQTLNGVSLHGVRKSRTLAAEQSGTGKAVVVTDEYWYSPELSIYMLVKHNDPRTGEQIVAVSEVDRREPDSSQFSVPANFKVADETPVE